MSNLVATVFPMRALSLLLLCFVAACSSSPPRDAGDNFSASELQLPAAGSLIVLTPTPKQADFVAGEVLLVRQLHAQLQSAGYRVVILDEPNYKQVWAQELAAVGGLYDPNTGTERPGAYVSAMSNLASRVCIEAKCSLLMSSRLALRRAELSDRDADWDGQRRRMVVTYSAGDSFSFSGHTTALSVEVFALAADGKPLFRRFGGASLPYATNAARATSELRADLFASDVEIADGVRIALRPLIKR